MKNGMRSTPGELADDPKGNEQAARNFGDMAIRESQKESSRDLCHFLRPEHDHGSDCSVCNRKFRRFHFPQH
ncbi:MAG: hypothetical protein NTW79_00525 [Candidatus Berkelbacteria bacterium]|nr:hypothetical protein [Candidatus Berkelbacteria bacterium]